MASPYSWRIARDHHDDWSVTSDIIDQLKDLAPNAGPYRWNDPDFLMVRLADVRGRSVFMSGLFYL
jgi:hypothetical protein